MTKIFVIPGHGAGDPGACAYGYSEAERVRALATRMKQLGGDSVMLADFNRNYYADNGISRLNISKEYQIVELHMDSASASARGGHVVIKQGFNPDAYDNALADFIGGYFPGRAKLITPRSDLANPNRAAAAGYSYRLLECCFISNQADLTKFNTHLDEVARGILNAFGIAVEKPKRDMSEAGLNGIGTQTYTGSEIRPKIVSNAGATFTTSYFDNVEVGWGKAVATGTGDWVGEGELSFKILPKSLVPYYDIDPAAWYVKDIQKTVEKGFMSGIGPNFLPDEALTRAQAVVVIYRAAGMTTDTLPYTDVEQAPWYYDAAKWATKNDILSGYGGVMRPDDACTRAEFVTMLARWLKVTGTVKEEYEEFEDWAFVPGYAVHNMAWAIENGIVKGNDGYIRPNANCTRAEAAAMINRIKEAK